MIRILFFVTLLSVPYLAFAQYPNNPNKMRLGFQTTGNGLTYRGNGVPAYMPTGYTGAYSYQDTTTNVVWVYQDSFWYATNTINRATPPPFSAASSGLTLVYGYASWKDTDDGHQYTYIENDSVEAWVPATGIYYAVSEPANIAAGAGTGAVKYTTGLWNKVPTDSLFRHDGADWIFIGSGGGTTYLNGDGGTVQTLSPGDTIKITTGPGLSSWAMATDQVKVTLDSTGVVEGTYNFATVTVNAQGRITLITAGVEIDGSFTNEGMMGVASGGSNSATLYTNTSGNLGTSFAGGAGILVTETTSPNGGTITHTADTVGTLATQYDISGFISGSGTLGRVPRFTATRTLADGTLRDDGTLLAIGGATVTGYSFYDYGTSGWRLPVGTTAQRPTVQTGAFRFNTTLGHAEMYGGTNWLQGTFPAGTSNYTLRYNSTSGIWDASSIITNSGTSAFVTTNFNPNSTQAALVVQNQSDDADGVLAVKGSNNVYGIYLHSSATTNKISFNRPLTAVFEMPLASVSTAFQFTRPASTSSSSNMVIISGTYTPVAGGSPSTIITDYTITSTFQPAGAGLNRYAAFYVSPTITQNGVGHTGKTYGFLIDPVISNAYDFTGISLAFTSGTGVYQSGASVKNYFVGKTALGSTSSPSYILDAGNSTDAFRLPVGTTAQRPTHAAGIFRYNSSTPALEYSDGSTWHTVGTGTGTMSSWTLAGTSGTPQTVSNSETATVAAGFGMITTAGATRTVTVAVDTVKIPTMYNLNQIETIYTGDGTINETRTVTLDDAAGSFNLWWDDGAGNTREFTVGPNAATYTGEDGLWYADYSGVTAAELKVSSVDALAYIAVAVGASQSTIEVESSEVTVTTATATTDLTASGAANWKVSGTTKMTFINPGRLGINDTSPEELLDVAGNAKFQKIIGQDNTPTIATNANAGTGRSAAVTSSQSSDVAGRFYVTTGTGLTAGEWAVVSFGGSAFTNTPVVMLQAENANAASLAQYLYVVPTTTGFSVSVNSSAVGFESLTFEFGYHVTGGK